MNGVGNPSVREAFTEIREICRGKLSLWQLLDAMSLYVHDLCDHGRGYDSLSVIFDKAIKEMGERAGRGD